MVGTNLGKYKIIRMLGEGGMGVVYQGHFDEIERPVAIKVLHPHWAKNPEFVARFLNEARASNRTAHQGIVQITDCGQVLDGSLYIVMEYLDGELLGQRLKRMGGRLATQDAVYIACLLSNALGDAHRSGVVHRDLKPDNIMIVPDTDMPRAERTKIMDFGIAKLLATVPELPNFNQIPTHLKTRHGTIMGTPSYMAPEQCRESRSVDEKADIYALGIIIYEMLSGQLPFIGNGMGEILAQQLFTTPPSLNTLVPNVPPQLSALVHRMLEKEPAARPRMDDVHAELQRMDAELLASGTSAARAQTSEGRSRHFGNLAGRQVVIGIFLLALGASGGAYFAARRSGNWGHSHVVPASSPPSIAAEQTREVTILSQPSGAAVIDKKSGATLGKTPWRSQRPSAMGPERLIVRMQSYQDGVIDLPAQRNVVYNVYLRPAGKNGHDDDYDF